MTFWEIFYNLCEKNNTKPNTVAKELGFSSAVCTQWKKGLQNPSYDKLFKIAEYFGVTVEFLNGKEDKPQATASEWETLLSSLSDESLIQLRDYVRYLVWKQNQDHQVN